ncbi:hypothetical protein HDU88_003151 [Geranomyces variabilis]|nr:hypothetical protein HDU88_003151 [Geranomyces variabilis]
MTTCTFKDVRVMLKVERRILSIRLSFVLPGAYFTYKGFTTTAIRSRRLVQLPLDGNDYCISCHGSVDLFTVHQISAECKTRRLLLA